MIGWIGSGVNRGVEITCQIIFLAFRVPETFLRRIEACPETVEGGAVQAAILYLSINHHGIGTFLKCTLSYASDPKIVDIWIRYPTAPSYDNACWMIGIRRSLARF